MTKPARPLAERPLRLTEMVKRAAAVRCLAVRPLASWASRCARLGHGQDRHQCAGPPPGLPSEVARDPVPIVTGPEVRATTPPAQEAKAIRAVPRMRLLDWFETGDEACRR